MQRTPRSTGSVLALALLGGCGLPRLVDVDGRPILHPMLVGDVEGGLVVVDTAGESWRVIVELQVELPGPDPAMPPAPILVLGDGRTAAPRRLRQYEPVCADERRARARDDASEVTGFRRPFGACLAVIHAEFGIQTGQAPDSFQLLLGPRLHAIRWHRPRRAAPVPRRRRRWRPPLPRRIVGTEEHPATAAPCPCARS